MNNFLLSKTGRLLFQFLKPFAVPCGECRFAESAVTLGQLVVHDRVLRLQTTNRVVAANGGIGWIVAAVVDEFLGIDPIRVATARAGHRISVRRDLALLTSAH